MSVVIPVFNGEAFIDVCVRSVLTQSVEDIELLIINDGSTDNTIEILSQIQSDFSGHRINIKSIPRSGQGKARNVGLESAKGKYIIFLDSDDWISPVTLEECIASIQQPGTDLVNFRYRFFDQAKESFRPQLFEVYSGFDSLLGNQCEQLLNMRHYFSVTSMYRASFLHENNIRFGEGYFYEDFEFIVQVASHAKKINLLKSYLYTVRLHSESITNVNLDTSVHYQSFLKASKASLAKLDPRTEFSYYFLGQYLMRKFMLYYRTRVPQKYKKEMRYTFLNLLGEREIIVPKHTVGSRASHQMFKLEIPKKRNQSAFFFIIGFMTVVRQLSFKMSQKFSQNKT